MLVEDLDCILYCINKYFAPDEFTVAGINVSTDMRTLLDLVKFSSNARHRADIAAGAVGTEISGVKSISLNDVFFPPFYARAEDLSTQILPGQQEVTMTVNVVYFANGGVSGIGSEGTSDMEIARAFILSKLPGLGIEIDDELDLHTDMVAHISENELRLDYSVVDTDGRVHDGHIEVVFREVTVATLDGQSIL